MKVKTMDQTIQDWQESQFEPWKRAMQAHLDEQSQLMSNVRRHASELKYVVSLLLDKREREAVRAWNRLGLPPVLRHMELDLRTDTLTLEDEHGNRFQLALDVLLADLQAMLEGKAPDGQGQV